MRLTSSTTSRRSISQQLMRAPSVGVGRRIYLESGDDRVYKRATVVSQENTVVWVVDEAGLRCAVDLGFGELYYANDATSFDDMCAMEHLHEPAMLENLKTRTYAYVGTVLVAMNPFQPEPQPLKSDYIEATFGARKPHPYALAELAFQRLVGRDQSVVVGGESGAGKTETARMVVDYLAERGGEDKGGSLVDLVKALSPVLEALGNAATPRNPNSSRFGRYLKLNFDCRRRLVGGTLETYLLEKSRVSKRNSGPGESNFHALHHVVDKQRRTGSSRERRRRRRYVADQSTSSTIEQAAPRKENDAIPTLEAVDGALALIDATDAWRLLAATLALGDVDVDGDDSTSVIDVNSAALAEFADALGLDIASLEAVCRVVTHRTVKTKTETFDTPRDKRDGTFARDALARTLYAKTFDVVVDKCNGALGGGGASSYVEEEEGPRRSSEEKKKKRSSYIGILDVFGFESFEEDGGNAFETLLINFANESLQEHFCESIFEAEMRLFEEEGILHHGALDVTPPSSRGTLDLIAGSTSPPGILPLLDAQCAVGKNSKESDATFLAKVHQTHRRALARTHPKELRSRFHVHHYAAVVAYAVGGDDDGDSGSWTEANVDATPEGLAAIVQRHSTSPFARECLRRFDEEEEPTGTSENDDDASMIFFSQKKKNKKKKKTVASSFCQSMSKLRDSLRRTESAFVRCVKPNPKMIPGVVDAPSTCAQLRALGLLAACEVLKVGLPTRIPYEDLLAKLGTGKNSTFELDEDDKETVVAIALAAFEVPADAYRLGKTKVFFPASALAMIQSILAFDPRDDPKRAAAIEVKLKEAKENAGEARDFAKKARELLAVAEATAERAADTLRGAAAQRLDPTFSLSGSARSADVAARCALEAQTFDADAASYFFTTKAKAKAKAEAGAPKAPKEEDVFDDDSFESEARDLRDRVSVATKRTVEAAAEAERLRSEIEPVARRGEEMRVRAWETSNELAAKAGLLRQCASSADAAANAAARVQLERAKAAFRAVEGYVAEATRRAEEVEASLGLAAEADLEVRTKAEALGTAEHDANAHCDAARNAYDALRQHYVDRKQAAAAAVKEEALLLKERQRAPPHAEPVGALPVGESSARTERQRESSISAAAEEDVKDDDDKDAAKDAATQSSSSLAPGGTTTTTTTLPTPAGWEAHWDDHYGLHYYFNTVTGETRWEPPTRPARSSLEGEERPSMTMAPSSLSDDLQQRTSVKRRSFSFGAPRAPSNRASAYSASAIAALASKRREGYLMKQGRWTSRWKPRWFVLEDSILEYFEKKAHAAPGAHRTYGPGEKAMRLEARSVTSFTDTEHCFCVTTGQTSWFLVAPDERDMAEWIAAINAHILSLRGESNDQSSSRDDASTTSSSSTQAYFARVRSSVPLRAHAAPDAPATGDCLEENDLVQITRRVVLSGSSFARIADFKGWAPLERGDDPSGGLGRDASDLEEVTDCDFTEEAARYRRRGSNNKGNAASGVPVLRGPSFAGQRREGAVVGPTDVVETNGRFTHQKAIFLRLDDGRGWVPLHDGTSKNLLFEKVSATTTTATHTNKRDTNPRSGSTRRALSRLLLG